MKLILSLFLLLLTLNGQLLMAQPAAQEAGDESTTIENDKLTNIDILKENLLTISQQLKIKKEELAKASDNTQKGAINEEITRLEGRLNKSKNNLIETIADFKLDGSKRTPREIKKRTLLEEVENLISPTLQSIQRISAKPRRIERLKNRISTHEEQIRELDQAFKNLELIDSSPEFSDIAPQIHSTLNTAKDNIKDLRQENQIKINNLKSRLHELTKDDKSVLDVTTRMIKEFLSTKGKNLAISLGVFLLIIWISLKFREKIVAKLLEKRPDEWYVKPVKAFYGFASFLLAFGVSMFTLYTLGDWVLVTFVFLALAAILWSSKSYIPKYLTEFKLILNFGTIKEGELVVYHGLPWKVKSIGFMTIFENEFLDSQQIRIQITEIMKMHSRKILPKEQWFPSRTGDWVLLNDQTYGKVVSQTLEQVVMEIGGSQRRYIPTDDYLHLMPVNMSHGYILEFTWSFDYQDQKHFSMNILPKLESEFRKKMQNYVHPASQILVDFHSAGASSMNAYIMVKYEGSFASKRLKINRDLQQMLFDISTENTWNIPFNTISLHKTSAWQN